MNQVICSLCIAKNDEWVQHIISQTHIDSEDKIYCETCQMNYDKSYNHNIERNQSDRGCYHSQRDVHIQNQQRLDFSSS